MSYNLGKKIESIIKKAEKRALRDAVRGMTTIVRRDVSADTGIKQKLLRKRTLVRMQELAGRIDILSQFIPLVALPHRVSRAKKSKGVSVRIRGALTPIHGAFRSEMPSGHVGIFKQGNKRAQAKWVPRAGRPGTGNWFPIGQQYKPLSEVTNTESLRRKLQREAKRLINEKFFYWFRRFKSKAAGT